MSPPDRDQQFASDANMMTIGKLDLPSGHVVACDPYFCADAQCFSRSVPPGKYDVQVRRVDSPEWGERIALARLHIRPGEAVASFEPATRGPGGSGRFFVDSGVACYMDEVTRAAFAGVLSNYYQTHPEGNYYTDVIKAEFKANASDADNPLDLGKWNLHRVPGTELNVAMFASGLGDGWYSSWWGLADSGEVVSLVTDFGLT